MAYFDARSKGLVQTNNSKHFPIDQYLYDRMTPATLSPTPLAYDKPIHPTEMPCITTCTELSVDNTNKPTSDDKYPWLESDDHLLLVITCDQTSFTIAVPLRDQTAQTVAEALSGFSPFQLVFLRDPSDLTSLSSPKIDTILIKHKEYYNLLLARA